MLAAQAAGGVDDEGLPLCAGAEVVCRPVGLGHHLIRVRVRVRVRLRLRLRLRLRAAASRPHCSLT